MSLPAQYIINLIPPPLERKQTSGIHYPISQGLFNKDGIKEKRRMNYLFATIIDLPHGINKIILEETQDLERKMPLQEVGR